jgi:hypothetical protein
MHEDVVSAIESDKSKSFTIIEPLDGALRFHTILLFSTHGHKERISSSAESHGME